MVDPYGRLVAFVANGSVAEWSKPLPGSVAVGKATAFPKGGILIAVLFGDRGFESHRYRYNFAW